VDVLRATSLLSTFKAMPYEVPPLPEGMVTFGQDEEITDEPDANLNLDYECPADAWGPIATSPDMTEDSRLPLAFIDGAMGGVEIAGSAQDDMGYARSIRAGEMGVGALDLRKPDEPSILCHRYIAITAAGYLPGQLDPLRADLRAQPFPFELVTWTGDTDYTLKGEDQKELARRDIAAARIRLRNSVRRAMFDLEQRCVNEIGQSSYVDGLYADHTPATDDLLVIGIVKSMHRRYLDNARLPVLYGLKLGERTPVFVIKSDFRPTVATCYARICGTWGGPTNGLIRVEMSESHFRVCYDLDFGLFDAIVAQLALLRTTDTKYQRAAVTVEPIRVIEGRIQRLFHKGDGVAMSALNAFRQ
jgi:hypothetical protein